MSESCRSDTRPRLLDEALFPRRPIRVDSPANFLAAGSSFLDALDEDADARLVAVASAAVPVLDEPRDVDDESDLVDSLAIFLAAGSSLLLAGVLPPEIFLVDSLATFLAAGSSLLPPLLARIAAG